MILSNCDLQNISYVHIPFLIAGSHRTHPMLFAKQRYDAYWAEACVFDLVGMLAGYVAIRHAHPYNESENAHRRNIYTYISRNNFVKTQIQCNI